MAIPPVKVIISGVDRLSSTLGMSMKKINKMGKSVDRVGKKMTTTVTLPLLLAGAAAGKLSTDFNASMANVASLIPRSSDRVLELKKNVQDLSIVTGKATGDLADGLYQVVSAFGDAADSSEKLEIAAKAGVAGLAETTDAINLTSSVMKAYGDTSANAMRKVADLSFQTVKLGQTTFPELAGSIGRVAPLAQSFGLTMEEMFGTFATGTGVTGQASEVASQFSGILAAMMKPSAKMAGLMKHLGYENGRAMIAELGFQGALQKTADMAKKNNVELIELFRRKEATVLVTALAGAQSETFTKKLQAMKGATGALSEAFNEQTQGINKDGFAMKQATAKLVILGQKFGDILVPMFVKALNKLLPFVEKLDAMSPAAKKVIIVIGMLVAAVGPLLIILGKLLMMISFIGAHWAGLVTVFAFVGKAISATVAAIASPIGILVGLIVAAVGIWAWNIYQIVTQWEDVWGGFLIYMKGIGKFFKDFGMDIIEWLQPGLDFVTGIVDKIKAIGSAAMPKFLRDKLGLQGPESPTTTAADLRDQAAGTRFSSENTTNIRIDNRAGAKVRADVSEGDVNLETNTGLTLPGSYSVVTP